MAVERGSLVSHITCSGFDDAFLEEGLLFSEEIVSLFGAELETEVTVANSWHILNIDESSSFFASFSELLIASSEEVKLRSVYGNWWHLLEVLIRHQTWEQLVTVLLLLPVGGMELEPGCGN